MSAAVESDFLTSYAARDWPSTVATIDRHWVALTFSHATYRQMFAALAEAPDNQLRRSARVSLLAEVIGRLPGGTVPVTIPRGPARVEHALRDGVARDLLEQAVLGMIARRAGGLPHEAVEIATASRPLLRAAAATRFSPAADLAAYWHLQAGQAALHAGDIDQALLDLRQAWSFRDDDVTGYVAPSTAPFLALLATLVGDDAGSARWQDEVDRLEPDGRSLIEWETMERPRLVAWLLESSDRLDTATGRDLGRALLPQLAFDEIWPITLFALVRHLVDDGQTVRAEQLVETTVALHSSAPATGSFHAAFVALARAELALALGRVGAVGRVLTGPDVALLPALTSVYSVRLEIACGDLTAAHRLATVASHQDDRRARREGVLLRAVVAAEDSAPYSPSLRRTTSLLPAELRARLTATYGEDLPPANPGVVVPSSPVIRLTPGETRVLEALRGPGSLPEVADRLFISRNTLKSHLRALYAKLGVSSREAAVAVAGDLGLLGHDEGPPP